MTAVIALDFETYYDDKYSVRKTSTYNYAFDDRFEAYRVAIVGEGLEFVGNPKDFDWQSINGLNWVAHYAGFEAAVVAKLKADGIIPRNVEPQRYLDTADLAAYLRTPRNLKAAVKILLGVEIEKTVRVQMKGKHWEDLDDKGRREMDAYVLQDSTMELRLYNECGHLWPLKEQLVSDLNIHAGLRGVPANRKKAEVAEQHLSTLLWELGRQLPWVNPEPGGPKEAKPMSPGAARRQGVTDNIPVPSSFDARDPKVDEWEREYGPKFPWVTARRQYGRVNTLLCRVQNFKANIRENDDTLYYQCKYCGAGPGRFSGGSSGEGVKESGERFNVQNMPRDPMFSLEQRKVFMDYSEDYLEKPDNDWDVDVRGFIEAPKGWVYGVHDYRQVEARLLLWRCGDTETLDLIARTGISIYEAYARTKLGWQGGVLKKEDPDLYRLAKALVLGAGYQCWSKAFQSAARNLAGLDLELGRCETIIKEYRAANPKVVQYWAEHKKWFQISLVRKDPTHIVKLVSGRDLTYFDPQWGAKDRYGRTSMRARVVQTQNLSTFFGGRLTENEMQALSRDALVDSWVAMAAEGIKTLFTIHDEFVNLYPEGEAEDMRKRVDEIMVTAPDWAAGCPLEVESTLSKVYEK